MTSPADGDPAAAPGPAEPGAPGDGAPIAGRGPGGATAPTGASAGPRPPGDAVGSHRGGVSPAQIVSGDWPSVAADRIVDLVDTVRDRTAGTAQTAARAAVYGLMAAILSVVVLVLLIIFAIRGLDVLVNKFIPWGGIWLPYLIVGVILVGVGTLLFRRRRPSAG